MIKIEKYLFSWENLPETDGNKLRRFLKDNFDIRWVDNANIIKDSNDKIIISTDEESVEMMLDKKEVKATLKIDDENIRDIFVVRDNDKFNILDNKISQGDIYQNIEVIEKIEQDDKLIEIHKIIFPYVIILTQACDLAQDFSFRFNKKETEDKKILSVLVAPIYVADHVSNGEHLSEIRKPLMQPIPKKNKGKITTNWNKLILNETPRYHYLEFPIEVSMVPSIIDFKHYFSLNLEYLYEIKNKSFLCRISELYREDISQRFASFLSRIGLP